MVPYFKDSYKPVAEGDTFLVRGCFKTVEFKIVKTSPGDYITITPSTQLMFKDDPVKREDDCSLHKVGYDDIGGCKQQLAAVREMIELPLRHPELFASLHVSPPKNVLLVGPAGGGKTLISKAIANENGSNYFLINGPQIMA